MTSIQVINDWLAAWQAGDRQALHRLLPAGSVVHASQPPSLAGEYRGFEAAAEYFGRKAQHAGAGFSWEAGELIEVGPFVVMPFRLQADHRRPWWQLAVYRTENSHIAEIWLLEESHAPNDEQSDAARRPVQP